jgi:hypothetical protein
MTTPIIPQKPMASWPREPLGRAINKAVYDVIYDACMTHVELMPKTQAILEQRDVLVKEIENKVPRLVAGRLQDVAMTLACQFGDEMFRLGIAIGRDPASIFDMPEEG